MRLFGSFRAQQSGVEKSVFNRFLHFRPLCGPTVEMTKAQIIITIGIIPGRREPVLLLGIGMEFTSRGKIVGNLQEVVEIFLTIISAVELGPHAAGQRQ